jgi:hypothetical protein
MPFLNFFTLPTATSTLASVGAWSAPFFDELIPAGYLVAGFLVGGILVNFVIIGIIRAFQWLVGRRNEEE